MDQLNFEMNSECGKIPTRKTLNTDTFHAVYYVGNPLTGKKYRHYFDQ